MVFGLDTKDAEGSDGPGRTIKGRLNKVSEG